MLSWLLRLARRLLSSMATDSGDGPRDPHSYVRQPLSHRPGGRSAAVALEEPDEDQNLTLVARG